MSKVIDFFKGKRKKEAKAKRRATRKKQGLKAEEGAKVHATIPDIVHHLMEYLHLTKHEPSDTDKDGDDSA